MKSALFLAAPFCLAPPALVTPALAQVKKALEAIDKDQARLRENMKVLDKTSALYQTYAKKLSAQEEKVLAIDVETERLQSALTKAQNDLDEAIGTL